jgi:hypothetical protein
MWTVVVLPAPFGPRRPKTMPSLSARSIPSTAVTVPKRFVRPSPRVAMTTPENASAATRPALHTLIM